MKTENTENIQGMIYVTMQTEHSNEQTIKSFNLPLTVKVSITPENGHVWIEFKNFNSRMDLELVGAIGVCPTVLPHNLKELLHKYDIEETVASQILSWMADYIKSGTFKLDDKSPEMKTFHLPWVTKKVAAMLDRLYVQYNTEG